MEKYDFLNDNVDPDVLEEETLFWLSELLPVESLIAFDLL